MQMMRHLIAPAVLAFTMVSAVPSRAADLSVNGHIRSGGACNIALGNGGVVDLGNLSGKDLQDWGGYLSTKRNMSLTINCQQPTKVGFKVTDNRAGTKPPGTWSHFFGLGNPAVDGYEIYDYSPDAAIIIYRLGVGWSGGFAGYTFKPDDIVSWAASGAQKDEPMAFKTMTNELTFRFFFRKDIVFTDEIKIDGSATLELVYL